MTTAAETMPRSRKIYAAGSDPSIRVPMREISLTNGETHTVYDTSGIYTDPGVEHDIRAGLAPLRESWIESRNDTDELPAPTSIYRRGRDAMPELDAVRFTHSRKPRRATKWFPGNCELRPFALVTTRVMLSRSYSFWNVGLKLTTMRLSLQLSIPNLTGVGLF